jgi:ribosomal protein L7Ae-like RNA K-turn-binding protein
MCLFQKSRVETWVDMTLAIGHLVQEEEEDELVPCQPYCCQVITPELNGVAYQMLQCLRFLQMTRSLHGHKRYFCSLNEVSKVVMYARVLLVAPDICDSRTAHIEPVKLLQKIMAMANVVGVPIVFCLSRRGIGRVFGQQKRMSIVAVMDTDGVENEFEMLIHHGLCGRLRYILH